MGKVCSITDQSGNTETFRYDKEGREIQHTDRNGTVTETKYNVYGKPVLQVCTDNRGNRQIMGTWEYDSFGQLKKSVSGGFCYTYEYRPDGKLLNKWNNGRKVLSCTYYRDGSLKSQTGVSGKTVYYAYDGDGRLKYLKEGNSADSIKNADDSNVITLTEYHYTDAGRIKEITTKGGIRTSYTYDEDGNISRLTIGDGTEEGLLYDAFMIYDLNGNRTGKTGSRLDVGGKQAEMAVSYRYDSMNRLTNEDRNGAGERYAYDLCGNRLLKEQYSGSCVDATEGYRYNERNELTERVKAGSLTTYCYDKNGSIITEEEEGRRSEYRYDLLNRQIYVKTLDGKEQENFYDGENLRAGLTENGKKTTFLYHDGEILTESDGESAPIRRYLRGNGLSCVQTLDNQAYHAYHQDEQGSTAYITGQDNAIENCYQYDAFGNLLEKREDVRNRILYTRQQYDQETGQYYLRARYYNPVVGSFLQEDTYRGDGLNLYAYCANNPVVYYDPSGHVKNNCPEELVVKPENTQAEKVVEGITEEAFGKKLVNINDITGDLDDPNIRVYGTYDELTNAGVKDAHHIVQDAAVRDIPGYDRGSAPAIQADGPSTQIGSEHYNMTYDQSHATTGGTYGAERTIGMESVKERLDVSDTDMKSLEEYVDGYFCDELNLSDDSATRIPGNRHGAK